VLNHRPELRGRLRSPTYSESSSASGACPAAQWNAPPAAKSWWPSTVCICTRPLIMYPQRGHRQRSSGSPWWLGAGRRRPLAPRDRPSWSTWPGQTADLTSVPCWPGWRSAQDVTNRGLVDLDNRTLAPRTSSATRDIASAIALSPIHHPSLSAPDHRWSAPIRGRATTDLGTPRPRHALPGCSGGNAAVRLPPSTTIHAYDNRFG